MKSSKNKIVLCGTAMLAATTLGAARCSANLIDPLSQFDLIVLGNLTTSSEVEGAAFVGGNLTGTSNYNTQNQTPLPSIQLGNNTYNNLALTVGGTIASNTNVQVNNGGNLLYSGSVGSGVNLNMNGGGSKFISSSISTETSGLITALDQFSTYYSGLSANSTFNSGTNTFTVGASAAGGTAVFDITAAQFATNNANFSLDNSAGADFIVVNVSGTSDTFGSSEHFGSGFSAGNIIWNFSQANSVSVQLAIDDQFIGSILAPEADLSNTTQIDGSVAVGTFNQNGEIHLPLLDSNFPTPTPTPEPSALGIMAVGGLALLARRRRKA